METWKDKISSRKLWVWVFATGLLIAGKITPSEWSLATSLYLGSQGIADAFGK